MGDQIGIVVTAYMPTPDTRLSTTRAALSWDRLMVGGPRYVIFVDDGSPDDSGAAVVEVLRCADIATEHVKTDRLGCGGALNIGVRHVMQLMTPDVIFYGQSDWMLEDRLDLAPSMALLNGDTADVVRFGPTHPNLRGYVQRTAYEGAEWCLRYDWSFGGYVVGWRPALYHRRVFERFPLDGLDGLSAIEAERIWLERMAADMNPPRVFHAPNTTLAGPFRHLDTVELGEDAPEVLTARYA